MSERDKHLFEFAAEKIAEAAGAEADYHEKRARFWEEQYGKACLILKDTARVVFHDYPVSGGATRMDLRVDYGDPAAYQRMQECWTKAEEHRRQAGAYRMDAKTYGSQGGRVYQLDGGDVLHFRLGGGARES